MRWPCVQCAWGRVAPGLGTERTQHEGGEDIKTAFIAAGALLASTLAGLPDASANSSGFGLTIAGPNGAIQIGGPGKNHRHKKGKKAPGYNKGYGYGQGYGPGYGRGYGPGYGYGRGYGYGQRYDRPYPGYLNLRQARAQGYCMYPREIRRKLRRNGWRGFNVIKLKPAVAIVRSWRYGTRYRLKVNRCNGTVLKAKPLGGGGYGGYGGYRGYGGYGGYGYY